MTDMKRRDFLKTGAAIGAGTLAVTSPLKAQTPAELKKQSKPKKPFSTDPCAVVPLTGKVSCTRIGFGTGMRGYNRESNIVRMEEEKAVSLLRYAYDKGIRLFDMADLYGSHPLVAKALEGKPRDSYTLVSKLWYHDGGLPEQERPDPDVTIKRFLRECKVDYLDVLQIHCMMNGDWAGQFGKQMEIMERLKQEGLIRAHGVSCHANTALGVAAKTLWADVVHVRINHDGARMDGEVEGVVKVTRACHESGVGVIGMKIIGEGTFGEDPEKRKKSVDFVLNLDCVDAFVVGFDEKEHIDELLTNVKASLETMAKNSV
ncbi:MAG: aldo/keto reductase [Planctomycetaceae bacterium]|nr:aldo/keto reductase [Planctomycetaceae bacterium]